MDSITTINVTPDPSTNIINCRLFISGLDYIQLSEDIQVMFQPEEGSPDYFCDFPAYIDQESALMESIIAFCEISLVMGNLKYQVTETTKLKFDLFKLVKSSKNFSLILTIQYPNIEQEFNEILTFEEVQATDNTYVFRYLGDQTMFKKMHH